MRPFHPSSFSGTFQPKTIDQLCDIAYRASYLEISSEPKPGNVSPHQSIGKAKFENFVQGIQAIHQFNLTYFSPSAVNLALGTYIFGAVDHMIAAQNAGNVLLGHILLFSPLLFASQKLILNPEKASWDYFWHSVDILLNQTTVDDGIQFFRAIQLAKPGGMKNPGGLPFHADFDITNPDTERKIRDHQRPLQELFRESAEFDMISQEYLNNYQFCQKMFVNWLIPFYKSYQNLNDLVVDLFLNILASHYDSLIYRKNTLEIDTDISNKAKVIVQDGGIRTKAGKARIQQLNTELIHGKWRLNPGASADLTACVLFNSMLFGVLHI